LDGLRVSDTGYILPKREGVCVPIGVAICRYTTPARGVCCARLRVVNVFSLLYRVCRFVYVVVAVVLALIPLLYLSL
jgi:hypothetical protein